MGYSPWSANKRNTNCATNTFSFFIPAIAKHTPRKTWWVTQDSNLIFIQVIGHVFWVGRWLSSTCMSLGHSGWRRLCHLQEMTSKVRVESSVLAEGNDGMPRPKWEMFLSLRWGRRELYSGLISSAGAWAHQIRRAGEGRPCLTQSLEKVSTLHLRFVYGRGLWKVDSKTVKGLRCYAHTQTPFKAYHHEMPYFLLFGQLLFYVLYLWISQPQQYML